MTGLRRLSHLVAIVALGTVGALLILEASELISGQWRFDIARGLASVAFPNLRPWVPSLIGSGLALVGITLIAAQVAPPKKGLRRVHEVYKGNDGDTRIRGRAAVSAVKHELGSLDGVVEVNARVDKKTVHVEVLVDDRTNLQSLEDEARTRLGSEFWINLGLADFATNLLITHHRKPPRVR